MIEDSNKTNNNRHQLTDYYDPINNTLDIRSNGAYPSNVLSNLCSNGFLFDGILCGSMEGFLQSLKYQNKDKQRQICSMKGGNARKRSVTSWQTDQIIWWKEFPIDRQGKEFQKLIRRAYQAMFEQSLRFRDALMQTRGMKLTHSTGENNPYKTILTQQEFCDILTEIRDNYDKRDKKLPIYKKRIFIELDNVIINTELGFSTPDKNLINIDKSKHGNKSYNLINIEPMPGAIEAINELKKHFDIYILATALWENPYIWSDKMAWINHSFNNVFQKRIIVTHFKNLLKGEYLIHSNENNYNNEFEGECIKFGCEHCPDWNTTVSYLYKKEIERHI